MSARRQEPITISHKCEEDEEIEGSAGQETSCDRQGRETTKKEKKKRQGIILATTTTTTPTPSTLPPAQFN